MTSKFQKRISLIVVLLFGFGFFLLIFSGPELNIRAGAQDTERSQGLFNTERAIAALHAERKKNREKYLAEISEKIKGRESEPSGKVFKNVNRLKNTSARTLLRIMDIGYSRALGVDCTHCHVPGKWGSYEKTKKQVAVEMAKMSSTLNSQTLKSIPNIENPRPLATCTTCHRGEVIPSTSLPRRRSTNGERPPGAGELATLITQFGWEPASKILFAAKRDYPSAPVFTERGLTTVGYRILRFGRKSSAVEVFKVLVSSYPKSANAYDSLSDGLIALGDKKGAISNAEKAIKLANSDSSLSKKTRDGIVKSATDKLNKLKTR